MGAILAAPIRSQLLSRAGNASYRVGCSQMQGFRQEMEDEHSVCLALEGHPEVTLFAVYDGHAGARVSAHLAEELPRHLAKLDRFDDESLKRAMVEFDIEVGKQEFRNMGSTCCFALVWPVEENGTKSWHVTAVNVGDSRVMLLRGNGALVSMTEDHKPEDNREKARIYEAGGTVSNNRVDGGLAMSRAIGDFTYKTDPNLSPLQQKVIPLPDITHEVAFLGDRLLVVCDGVVERITNKEVAKYVHAKCKHVKDDPAEVMRELVLYSLARGSTDNQSAILVCFEDGTGYSSSDTFIAGPLSEYASDRRFVSAYLKNAKAWGQNAESLRAQIAEADRTMPKDWRKVTKPSEMGSPIVPVLLFVLLLAVVSYLVFRWESQDDDRDFI